MDYIVDFVLSDQNTLYEIFSYLDFNELMKVRTLSKLWQRIATDMIRDVADYNQQMAFALATNDAIRVKELLDDPYDYLPFGYTERYFENVLKNGYISETSTEMIDIIANSFPAACESLLGPALRHRSEYYIQYIIKKYFQVVLRERLVHPWSYVHYRTEISYVSNLDLACEAYSYIYDNINRYINAANYDKNIIKVLMECISDGFIAILFSIEN